MDNVVLMQIYFLSIFFYLLSYTSHKRRKQKIAVSYGLNNNYTYPVLVSMTSILENSYKNTYYTFYLLVEKETFKEENKIMFKHLQDKYDRCKVVILEMTNENLKNARKDRYPMEAYYRLLLPNLIPRINRLIYLDGDTMIFKDLTEMYNLEMNNSIILGFVDNSPQDAEIFGIKTYKYVTSGVLLIDLRKMRKEDITQKFIDFIENNKDKLIQEDQTVINIVLNGRIGFLPPKYGMWNFARKEHIINHNFYGNYSNGLKAYDEKEFYDAWQIPVIIHYVRAKPWKKKNKYTHVFYHRKWWEFARKTSQYDNIVKYYGGEK